MRRLDQLLANLGYCSRRGARDFLHAHAVGVKGRATVDPALKVNALDVSVDGEPLDQPEGVIVLLHKPVGLVCSHDAREGPNVYSLLPPRWRERNPQVTSIGRLDKDTSGLLILTDRSELVHQLTSPKNKVPKRYCVTVDRDLPADLPALFASGALLLDGDPHPCAPAELTLTGPRSANVVLTEGRYHQVRRMFVAACGATVLTLHRDRFGSLRLDDLVAGAWRLLPATMSAADFSS